MEPKIKKALYSVGGVAIAGIIAWGVYSPIKHSQTIKDSEAAKIEFVKKDNQRVADYNTLVSKYNPLLELTKKQTDSIHKLNANLDASKNNTNRWIGQFNNKNAEFEEEASLNKTIRKEADSLTNVTAELFNIIENNKKELNELETLSDSLRNSLESYKTQIDYQKDTIALIQNYLNAYVVSRRPIKERNLEKVFLPDYKVFLPTSKKEIKAIRHLNKDYKNQ